MFKYLLCFDVMYQVCNTNRNGKSSNKHEMPNTRQMNMLKILAADGYGENLNKHGTSDAK